MLFWGEGVCVSLGGRERVMDMGEGGIGRGNLLEERHCVVLFLFMGSGRVEFIQM